MGRVMRFRRVKLAGVERVERTGQLNHDGHIVVLGSFHLTKELFIKHDFPKSI
jgi:hypothetical protein